MQEYTNQDTKKYNSRMRYSEKAVDFHTTTRPYVPEGKYLKLDSQPKEFSNKFSCLKEYIESCGSRDTAVTAGISTSLRKLLGLSSYCSMDAESFHLGQKRLGSETTHSPPTSAKYVIN
jgi:hypothetical protein